MSKLSTKNFWEDRLSRSISLNSTGHRAFDYGYNFWLYKAQKDCLDSFLSPLKLNENLHVLDVGCGGGFFIEYFLNHGIHNIDGIDITEASIRYLKNKYPDLELFQSDISNEELPLEGPYDVVTAMSVLFHIIEDNEFKRALINISKLLNKSGVFIFCDTLSHSRYSIARHVKTRNLESYTRILNETGVYVNQVVPLYYLLNRTFLPIIGPLVISRLKLGKLFYQLDKYFRKKDIGNLNNMKLIICSKASTQILEAEHK